MLTWRPSSQLGVPCQLNQHKPLPHLGHPRPSSFHLPAGPGPSIGPGKEAVCTAAERGPASVARLLLGCSVACLLRQALPGLCRW